ncbi:ATP-NAD kinase [Alteromonas sp. KS69]|jgi:predicted polyphosphate/ATP-dependent NAD kinase|uniref:ATP-NAD/AcoX kinase n=1 Tax=Alteromonas naphthalenivorans TaxID=715451 RepID=F5ZCF4_ALTNA|nr:MULTISPECIES: ATP-NAD kinase family protein [Alteromonas]AEF02547.1 ATP-NAD/AcoX kinase [Alteromonas naphthalenivorans]MBO7922820.1 ATP-NAD kinase family protein [Alteromonas sp. K632G]PHS55206.1 MAG: ATP-NAD kinase [Alteromonas sp.]RUP83856.1 ATP-NAD kinase [Alteromonas sp. KS69]|tara:strand:+ start:1864 stop:2994 length:1131 start_codon:yes stop_codon:yes gene_type:complete
MNKPVFRLGVVVNPFAGIGGALALKGSDGADVREKALAMGAEKKANEKMAKALSIVEALSEQFTIVTAAGEMGEDVCASLGLPFEVVYKSASQQTEGEDTERAVQAFLNCNLDVILFAGGDGTARNVCKVVGEKVPVLGVPAGCKIHSGVYCVTPSAAGQVISQMIKGEIVSVMEGEVRDIDENAFRTGKVIAKHYGEMRVPAELTYVQAVKMGGKEDEALVLDDIAATISELMDDNPDTYFVMGSGSTVGAVMEFLGLENTLLGVDVVLDKTLVASDVTASELLSLTQGKPTQVVLTVIGGQGHILGRGNQQLSPDFIRAIGKQNMRVVATKQKLQSLGNKPLRLDSGDAELDASLQGAFTIITGYKDKVLYNAE